MVAIANLLALLWRILMGNLLHLPQHTAHQKRARQATDRLNNLQNNFIAHDSIGRLWSLQFAIIQAIFLLCELALAI